MIIVEGPDGSGKSTLVRDLAHELHLPVQGRAVSAQTKAMVNLRLWTEQNLEGGFQAKVFDRHRLISDPIYQAVLADRPPNHELYDRAWLITALRQFYDIHPLVIYCLPELSTVEANVLYGDDDNSVIAPHITRIYHGYIARFALDLSSEGRHVLSYDYERNEFASLMDRIEVFLDWRLRDGDKYYV